jgi:hypothetical protein
MSVIENNSLPYMKSMATCLSRVIKEGYTEDFRVTENGLEALLHHKIYKPEEINIINSFKFEGLLNREDYAFLYIIETKDGTKGTLTNAYGIYLNSGILDFIKHVESIKEKKRN